METLFIADLHLSPEKPEIFALFQHFLTHRVLHAQTLYILGDLFEAWLGDDEDHDFYQTVIHALKKVSQAGVNITVLHGNRDFLLGEQFAQRIGCQLLTADSLQISLYGTPTLLMHGDTLCTADLAYQTFRQQVRQSLWQKTFLAYPLAQRRVIAQQARSQSQAHQQQLTEMIMDVTPDEVVAVVEKMGVQHLIHGHTHRPALHQFNANQQTAYRYVVGDWQATQAIILACTPMAWTLENYAHQSKNN
ncbi:UDP-2,3-diacylglucosamine diphosphatase [Beggiatoa leptomitoformis]|uniref:UDP-2,3-diacylglucosamine hydrolase n=1 Tax=Beggiatoa leptomitoformis TaxID=288004 RepID=A0A2N9YGW6_9GAMM|nr:UDP-2,3-diacylglucosamine diphosphatase [Beggiatoa leptomitoformis]ALG67971.1 UDP-2,3-diacylglucosamine diphosphatase [Beggiatoa leptomitoformis]AUI69750.1 UDP-2,3-diacylglucosamine diphosphatase [Beggiatoa leptomitoformis]